MIHDKAIVSPEAIIHDEVEIGPYSVIGSRVEIGERTRLGPHVVINGPTRIGCDNHIYQFASLGEDPQDKKYEGERSSLEIGDRNTIREFCTVSRGTRLDADLTRIGDDNWVMAYCHIAHDCHVGSHTVFANGATLGGHVHVGDYAILGGYTGIHQFCQIGAHSFLGMFSAISKDVPAYIMTAGQPAKPRGVNTEGLRRRDFSERQIRNIKDAFRIVYRQGLKLAEAIEQLEALVGEQAELQPMLDSLRASTRGILR